MERCFLVHQRPSEEESTSYEDNYFQKVIEVLTMFKGGIDSSTLLKDAKNGFIMVSSQYIISVLCKFMEHQENCNRDGRK